MSFKDYLFDKFKRIGIFIVGALLLPIGGIIASIGYTTTKRIGSLPEVNPNPIFLIIGVIVFISGFIVMGYAYDKK